MAGFKVETRDIHGRAVCPVCATPVEQAGTFDSPSCYNHFLIVIQDSEIVFVDDDLLELWQMPWVSQDSPDYPDVDKAGLSGYGEDTAA